MHRYILHRLLLMLPTLLGVAVLVFLLMRVIPGDIVEMRFAEGRFFNRELVEKERARFGLDRPLWVQFGDWMWGSCAWILACRCGPALLFARRSPSSAMSLQLAVMRPWWPSCWRFPGNTRRLRQDTWIDYAIRIFSIAGLATPRSGLDSDVLVLSHCFSVDSAMVFTPFCGTRGKTCRK